MQKPLPPLVIRNETTHGMLAGFPLCKFTKAQPWNWPQGHFWVEIKRRRQITCPECRTKVREMRAKAKNKK